MAVVSATSPTNTVADTDLPQFGLPIDCSLPKDCIIQNYMDVRPGVGYRDYSCGTLSYERHRGTDFRVKDYKTFKRGVRVHAALSGTVINVTRDKEEGEYIKHSTVPTGQESGNSVTIQHHNDWQTKYVHLRKGSIRVAKGDEVNTGDILGIIGLSGKTAFPHLHFQVSYKNQPKDPFTALSATGCAKETDHSLWSHNVIEKLNYLESGLIEVGFSSKVPIAHKLPLQSERQRISFKKEDNQLIFWADLWGVRIADRLTVSFQNPKGKKKSDQISISKNQAASFKYLGTKSKDKAMPVGTYIGEVKLERIINGHWTTLVSHQENFTIKP